jgi:hypothetical protein
LVGFIRNLAAWYETHLEIEHAGTAGNLSATASADLARRIVEQQASAEYLVSLIRGER